jgi:ATP-dependent Clp protease ATP-binding subunit ClpX
MMQVLTEPRNALVKQYRKLFAMEGVELTFDRDALDAIIDRALTRGTGARALRSIMESTLMELMYELPDNKRLEKVVITRAMVEKKGGPILLHREEKKAA